MAPVLDDDDHPLTGKKLVAGGQHVLEPGDHVRRAAKAKPQGDGADGSAREREDLAEIEIEGEDDSFLGRTAAKELGIRG